MNEFCHEIILHVRNFLPSATAVIVSQRRLHSSHISPSPHPALEITKDFLGEVTATAFPTYSTKDWNKQTQHNLCVIDKQTVAFLCLMLLLLLKTRRENLVNNFLLLGLP